MNSHDLMNEMCEKPPKKLTSNIIESFSFLAKKELKACLKIEKILDFFPVKINFQKSNTVISAGFRSCLMQKRSLRGK